MEVNLQCPDQRVLTTYSRCAGREDAESREFDFTVVLVMHFRDGLFVFNQKRGYWELPGGRREPGEDLFTCAAREVQEEGNLSIKTFSLLGRFATVRPGEKPKSGLFLFAELSARPPHDPAKPIRWHSLDAGKLLTAVGGCRARPEADVDCPPGCLRIGMIDMFLIERAREGFVASSPANKP
jgi:8-oxo-dGTP pyrophosphatase MutT (NUDIX family)